MRQVSFTLLMMCCFNSITPLSLQAQVNVFLTVLFDCRSLSFPRCRGAPHWCVLTQVWNSNHDRFWIMNKLPLKCYQNACLGYNHCKLQLLRGEQLLWQTHRERKYMRRGVHDCGIVVIMVDCMWLLCVLMVAVSLCPNEEHYWEDVKRDM